jgi:hypothetical protein
MLELFTTKKSEHAVHLATGIDAVEIRREGEREREREREERESDRERC